jgi:hypothetical protein
MYPSNYMGAHEVREITSGVRWAYLGFFCHGDRSLTTDEPSHKHVVRHAWAEKLKMDVDKNSATRLNVNQKKVM